MKSRSRSSGYVARRITVLVDDPRVFIGRCATLGRRRIGNAQIGAADQHPSLVVTPQ